jgi:hypothetical protein
MLTALRSGLRFRLAIVFAALAALCFAAPPAVLAFGHGAHTVYCLAHADMVEHAAASEAGLKTHGDHSAPAGAHHMTCCGLFCLSAISADGGEVISGIGAGSAPLPAPESHHLGQGPERPDRPPIARLSS